MNGNGTIRLVKSRKGEELPMSGLREKKKAKTREAILRTAKRLFISQGYTNTAMSDIALDCEVGVGTLYNYYKSKSELLMEIFLNDLPNLSNKVEAIRQDDSLDLREKLHRVITQFMSAFHQFPRSFYRELFAVVFNDTGNTTEVFHGMVDTDKQFMALLAEMLEREKRSCRLSATYPVDTSVGLMYSALAMQIMMYLFDDRVSEEQILSEILDQIDFLLQEQE